MIWLQFGQMTTDFQRPNFRNSSLTFPPKKCESLLANCGENRLQSIGDEKNKQTNKQKTKQKQQQKTKKPRQGLLRFSPSFLFAFFLFSFPFSSVWCDFGAFFALKKPAFWPARLSPKWLQFSLATFFKKISSPHLNEKNSKCVILQY